MKYIFKEEKERLISLKKVCNWINTYNCQPIYYFCNVNKLRNREYRVHGYDRNFKIWLFVNACETDDTMNFISAQISMSDNSSTGHDLINRVLDYLGSNAKDAVELICKKLNVKKGAVLEYFECGVKCTKFRFEYETTDEKIKHYNVTYIKYQRQVARRRKNEQVGSFIKTDYYAFHVYFTRSPLYKDDMSVFDFCHVELPIGDDSMSAKERSVFIKKHENLIMRYVFNRLIEDDEFKHYNIPINFLKIYAATIKKNKLYVDLCLKEKPESKAN